MITASESERRDGGGVDRGETTRKEGVRRTLLFVVSVCKHTCMHSNCMHTHRVGSWRKSEAASRYQRRLVRKYGAILFAFVFYGSLPVRVSKESSVQWTFTVHTHTHHTLDSKTPRCH